MPRVKVIADDGWVALDEAVLPGQVASEHYRRQLGERLEWAVGDASAREATVPAAPARPALRAA